MKTSIRTLLAAASILLQAVPSLAQTYTNCNPLTQGGCPANSALGRTVNIDFRDGASDSFTATGSPTYGSDGASFTVAKAGDSPVLMSRWYIMFGKVSVTMKAAHGTGIVSSVVIQSDCLDEIDWEWLGKDGNEVQSNYFGKGNTATYNRGAFHSNPGNQDEFITYTIDWTAEQIVWQINGVTVRVLKASDAAGQYPQTPSNVRLGAWSGGDSSNSQGTIEWAGGYTDYSAGPYTMNVQSITVQDYSSGSSYEYGGTDGTWEQVKSNGGSIYSGSGSGTDSSAPAITSVSSGGPIAFEPANRSVYPWVADSTTLATATATYTTYPGLPSGWTVTESGKVVPPSSAPSPYPDVYSTGFVQPLPQAYSSLAGYEAVAAAVPSSTITNDPRSNYWHSASKVASFLFPSAPASDASAALYILTSATSSVTPSSSASPYPSSWTTSTSSASITSSTSYKQPPNFSNTSRSTFSRLPQGTLTPSTPAVPVEQSASSASVSSLSLYPAALFALGMLTSLYML